MSRQFLVRLGAAYLFDAAGGRQLHKLTATDAERLDTFGIAVAIDQDLAIVGSLGDGQTGAATGAAYVFDALSGAQLHKLTAADAAALDLFGRSVDISGPTAIVGAILDETDGVEAGSAYLFDAHSGQQLFKLTATDATRGAWFGMSVAIDGQLVVVGAPHAAELSRHRAGGAAYVFDTLTGQQQAKLVASDGQTADHFGTSVALNGRLAIVGSPGHHDSSGAAYLFDVDTGEQLFKWTSPDVAPGDQFGYSVGIDGNRVLVGAWLDDQQGVDAGAVYVFDAATGLQLLKFVPPGGMEGAQFGCAASLDGDLAIVGGPLG